MDIVTTVDEIRERVRSWRTAGEVVGFVPTMGALHEGHLYLIRTARHQCDRVVVSIFVNPLQFGQSEDFGSYPRDLNGDAHLAQGAGCDVLFAPSMEVMYPERIETTVSVAGPAQGLCGASRPGHFDGVATVVAKLFNIVSPQRAYFGRKDAQQLAVVRRMTKDLDFPVTIIGCPTVREPSGLAYSSRNKYLAPEARLAALCLHRGLVEASKLARSGETRAEVLERAVAQEVDREPLARLDYAELRDSNTIEKLEKLPDEGEALLAVAAYISNPGESQGGARLIDNVFFEIRGTQLRVDEGVVVAQSDATPAQSK
jgi:pantoate--beta-alanine ligase